MDIHWDNDDREEGEEFGVPVMVEHPFPERMDFEMLILSLTMDQAKIVLIRHFGLRGKKAAKTAGFSSEWSLYRREHDFKKYMERKREHFFG